MPLDSAIVATSTIAGGTFIFAVRGPYLMRINATTGALIASAKVDPQMTGPTSIAYNPITDRLLIAGWCRLFPGITDNDPGPFSFNNFFYLYTVDPSTLLVDSFVNLRPLIGGTSAATGVAIGPWVMKWLGIGEFEGLYGLHHDPNISFLWRYGMSTVITGNGHHGTPVCVGNISNDFAWDGTNSVYWARSDSEEVTLLDMTQNNGLQWAVIDQFDLWSGDSSIPFGIEVAPSTGDIYAGTQNGLIKRLNYSAGFTLVSSLNTTMGNTIFKVRYNPFDGLLYCPCFAEDKVAVVDPATMAISGIVRTGFDSPWDVIFTSTKKWVVQAGNLGIKELV
jgi:hypothetical protein